MVNGEFVVNPSQADWDNGDLQLTVASTSEKVIMIEAGANEITEEKMIEAIYMAHEINQTIIAFIDNMVAEIGKEKHAYTSCAVPEEMFAAMQRDCHTGRDGRGCIYRCTNRFERKISVPLQKNWKRHLQRMKSGLRFSVKLYISIRKRLFVR